MFGLNLYSDPRLYELLAPADVTSLSFFSSLLCNSDRILELACGTGDLARCLSERSHVVGLDASPQMISFAKAKYESVDRLTFVVGDMRRFAFDSRFDAVIIADNSFQHLLSLSEIHDCLSFVQRHMNQDSRLVLDIALPDQELLSGMLGAEQIVAEAWDEAEARKIVLREVSTYDAVTQINHRNFKLEIDGDLRASATLPMRMIFPQEMIGILQHAGFSVQQRFGSHRGDPLAHGASKQIYVCRIG